MKIRFFPPFFAKLLHFRHVSCHCRAYRLHEIKKAQATTTSWLAEIQKSPMSGGDMSYSRCSHPQRRARRLGVPVQELPTAYKFVRRYRQPLRGRHARWSCPTIHRTHPQRRARRLGAPVQEPPILYVLTHPVCRSRKRKPQPAKYNALFPHGCNQLRKQSHLFRRQALCVQILRRLIVLSPQQIVRTAPIKIRQRKQILRAGRTLPRLVA